MALLLASPATAQSDDDSAEQQAQAQGRMVEVEPPSTTTSSSYQMPFVPAPGTNLDAHLPSSAQSKSDINQPDTFDLRDNRANHQTLHGDKDALGVLDSDRIPSTTPEPRNALHVVKKGETLWAICKSEFDDPHMWPRVWSFNPQLQNPHWIYPGDQLRLGPAASSALSLKGGGFQGGTLGQGNLVGLKAMVPPETIFLRDLGYIDEPGKDVWGQVVGAREEQQLLSEGNQIYLMLRPGVQLEIGQQLTVFRDVRTPVPIEGARMPPGKIISFQGTVRVDSWDERTRVARGELIESLGVVERGAKVGPVGRRFYVVPPSSSEVDLRARVLTSLYPHEIMGRDQVLFIDRGANDGLKAGNRLFVVRRGDAWRRTLVSTTVMARSRIRMDVPERVEIEPTPLLGDEEAFPEEVVAEVRVVRSHPYSSLALVVRSTEEVEPGDELVARKGY